MKIVMVRDMANDAEFECVRRKAASSNLSIGGSAGALIEGRISQTAPGQYLGDSPRYLYSSQAHQLYGTVPIPSKSLAADFWIMDAWSFNSP